MATKKYVNDEITIIWKPEKCIHSGNCVKALPKVYDPESRPWIKPENASGSELQRQIETCPSGALSYQLRTSKEAVAATKEVSTKVEVLSNGPLMVSGIVEVHLPDGRMEKRKRSTAFCRCGGSGNKPYCDGTHNHNGFKD